jgi:hypothetical protein
VIEGSLRILACGGETTRIVRFEVQILRAPADADQSSLLKVLFTDNPLISSVKSGD